jgi:hypothetical protein
LVILAPSVATAGIEIKRAIPAMRLAAFVLSQTAP